MNFQSNIRDVYLKKHIYIYGAGTYAMNMYEYLSENVCLKIDGFIVSYRKDIKERNLLRMPVYALDEIEYSPDMCGVILALSEKYHKDVRNLLSRKGFINVAYFSDNELKAIEYQNNIFSLKLIEKYRVRNIVKKSHTENFLVVRSDGIGDMVLTTPFLRELRRNHPCAHITLVTSSVSLDLFNNCPYLDEVLSYSCQKIIKLPLKRKLENLWQFTQENLQIGEYDFAILPRWDTDWYGASFLAFMSGAIHKIAYSEKVNTDKAYYNHNYDSMFTHLLYNRILKHEVERNMDVLFEMGDVVGDTSLELWETSSDRCHITEILKDFLQEGYRLIAVGISASTESKKWNIKNYSRLINLLRGKNMKFILIGSVEDADLSQIVFSDCDVLNLVGKLSLNEIVALMRSVTLYVGNDTGVMHIAAACGVKIVEIRGNDNVMHSTKRFHPWGVKYVILQSKSDTYEDIDSISVADVAEKVYYLL